LLPEVYGKSTEINCEIYRQHRLAEDILQFAISKKLADPVSFLKATFTPEFKPEKLADLALPGGLQVEKINLDFFHQFSHYISQKLGTVSPKMVGVYNTVVKNLKSFEDFRKRKIEFNDIDFNFYEDFKYYFIHEHIHHRHKYPTKGLKLSTAEKTIKQLRIFLRNRIQKGIIHPINLTEFRTIDEESDAIYLATTEVLKIHRLNLTSFPELEQSRDLFLLGCLSGLRFSDYSDIRPEDIKKGAIYKKQQKVKPLGGNTLKTNCCRNIRFKI
jgi:Phage integrase SAM-like domain